MTVSIHGIHPQTRETAANIRSTGTTKAKQAESFKCEYDRFEKGANSAELVLLEYCGVPGRDFFDAMNIAIAGHIKPAHKGQG